MSRVLIVDQDDHSARFLADGLLSHGYQSYVVDGDKLALAVAGRRQFEVVLVDERSCQTPLERWLPRFREYQSSAAILVIGDDGCPEKLSVALDSSADDYVTRPVVFEELVARIRSRMRPAVAPQGAVLAAGGIELDLRSRRAVLRGGTIDLTAREFALAETFFRHPDQVLSPQQLLNHVWGYDYTPDSNIVAVYVRTLRRKLGTSVIETVRGMGYRLAS